MTNQVEKLFTQTFFASNARFSSVFSFREVAKIGLEKGLGEITMRERQGAISFFTNPENDHLFTDKSKALEAFGGIDGFVNRNLQTKVQGFQAAVDAASLVFAHSVLDDAALGYCRVMGLHAPEEFLFKIRDKQVKLGEAIAQGASELIAEKVNGFLNDLERESLVKKIDLLFAICQPQPGQSSLKNFVFDMSRLRQLDSLRHDFVHKQGNVLLPKGEEDIEYLRDTGNHLMGLLNERFGLRMSHLYMAA